MKTLATRHFMKWAKKQKLPHSALRKASEEIKQGQFEANLGGQLIKKRVAINQKGKRGGTRVILFYKEKERLIYMHGFQKNEQTNLTNMELKALKITGKVLGGMAEAAVLEAVKIGNFVEISS